MILSEEARNEKANQSSFKQLRGINISRAVQQERLSFITLWSAS